MLKLLTTRLNKFPLIIYFCNESSLSDNKTVKHAILFLEFSFYFSNFHSRVTSKSLTCGTKKNGSFNHTDHSFTI